MHENASVKTQKDADQTVLIDEDGKITELSDNFFGGVAEVDHSDYDKKDDMTTEEWNETGKNYLPKQWHRYEMGHLKVSYNIQTKELELTECWDRGEDSNLPNTYIYYHDGTIRIEGNRKYDLVFDWDGYIFQCAFNDNKNIIFDISLENRLEHNEKVRKLVEKFNISTFRHGVTKVVIIE